jgi:hypothetical protein
MRRPLGSSSSCNERRRDMSTDGDGDEARIWIEQPSTERYERLAGKLINVERERSRGEVSDLRAAFDSLRAVIEFLRSDPELAKHRAASSLGAIAMATHDLINGAKPQLFFKRETGSRKGAPTNSSRAAARAQINVALDSLIEAGIPMAEACKWLAQELAKEGVKLGGRRIEAKQINACHYEKNGNSQAVG